MLKVAGSFGVLRSTVKHNESMVARIYISLFTGTNGKLFGQILHGIFRTISLGRFLEL